MSIEGDVWIGHNAIILPGCRHIGRGAVIGAGAIVTHDVASYSIVVGNPARKLRDRFEPALVEAIEATKWWELSIHELRELIVRDSEIEFAPTAANVGAWQNDHRALG
ncbi:MAG: hypothetical protein C0481_08690 [Phenylobacterium sp.]|uniref:hypothetical protein n=1 Tax=Phenylobacterium sp. TaxID=1871053 RepID=UPI0025F20AE5|nr:hypothetical protein [Phenylobacterium sp.]MBA4011928.1 hypothetical protein [Phenylobacterium sp.]